MDDLARRIANARIYRAEAEARTPRANTFGVARL